MSLGNNILETYLKKKHQYEGSNSNSWISTGIEDYSKHDLSSMEGWLCQTEMTCIQMLNFRTVFQEDAVVRIMLMHKKWLELLG